MTAGAPTLLFYCPTRSAAIGRSSAAVTQRRGRQLAVAAPSARGNCFPSGRIISPARSFGASERASNGEDHR